MTQSRRATVVVVLEVVSAVPGRVVIAVVATAADRVGLSLHATILAVAVSPLRLAVATLLATAVASTKHRVSGWRPRLDPQHRASDRQRDGIGHCGARAAPRRHERSRRQAQRGTTAVLVAYPAPRP